MKALSAILNKMIDNKANKNVARVLTFANFIYEVINLNLRVRLVKELIQVSLLIVEDNHYNCINLNFKYAATLYI